MPLTPVEIRHVQLRRAFFGGYRRRAVEDLLNEVAASFEEVWRERADLSDRTHELEADAAKHHELEALLRSTLVSAERAAHDIKEQARRESDLIVQEAHAEARRVTREAATEKRKLEEGMVTIRTQLRAALDMLTDETVAREREQSEREAAQAAEPAPAPAEDVSDSSIRKIAG